MIIIISIIIVYNNNINKLSKIIISNNKNSYKKYIFVCIFTSNQTPTQIILGTVIHLLNYSE